MPFLFHTANLRKKYDIQIILFSKLRYSFQFVCCVRDLLFKWMSSTDSSVATAPPPLTATLCTHLVPSLCSNNRIGHRSESEICRVQLSL